MGLLLGGSGSYTTQEKGILEQILWEKFSDILILGWLNFNSWIPVFPDFSLTHLKFPDFSLTFYYFFKIPWLFPDWKKLSDFSRFSRFSSVGGNPVEGRLAKESFQDFTNNSRHRPIFLFKFISDHLSLSIFVIHCTRWEAFQYFALASDINPQKKSIGLEHSVSSTFLQTFKIKSQKSHDFSRTRIHSLVFPVILEVVGTLCMLGSPWQFQELVNRVPSYKTAVGAPNLSLPCGTCHLCSQHLCHTWVIINQFSVLSRFNYFNELSEIIYNNVIGNIYLTICYYQTSSGPLSEK